MRQTILYLVYGEPRILWGVFSSRRKAENFFDLQPEAQYIDIEKINPDPREDLDSFKIDWFRQDLLKHLKKWHLEDLEAELECEGMSTVDLLVQLARQPKAHQYLRYYGQNPYFAL